MNGNRAEFVWTIFEPGTSVVLDEGPLAGLRGTVLGVDENQRLIVSVALLRGVIPVAVDPSGVRIHGRPTAVQPLTH